MLCSSRLDPVPCSIGKCLIVECNTMRFRFDEKSCVYVCCYLKQLLYNEMILTVHINCNIVRFLAILVRSFATVFAFITLTAIRNGKDLIIFTKLISSSCRQLNLLIILVPFYIKGLFTYKTTIQDNFIVNIEVFVLIRCVHKCR